MKKCSLSLLVILSLLSGFFYAQSSPNAASYWFGGFNSNIGKKSNLLAYYGFSPDDKFTAAAIMPYFKVHKNIHLMPSYMMIQTSGSETVEPTQHHWMPSVILNFKLNSKLILTDRNMYFRITMKDRDDVSFYRNRLGLTYLTKIAKKPTALYIHDAVFWSLDSKKFYRNRLILGGMIQWKKWLSPQFMYVLQNEPGFFPRHQFYFVLTVPLGNFGIFNKRQNPQELAPEPEHKPVVQDF